MAFHVSPAEFSSYVERALADVPEPFATFLEEVPVEVRDRPTTAQLRNLGLATDELLMGLYVGRPLTQRSVEHSGVMPDVIYIFQEDIELISGSAEQLVEEIRVTVLHEIGHHFGMNEEELRKLGYG